MKRILGAVGLAAIVALAAPIDAQAHSRYMRHVYGYRMMHHHHMMYHHRMMHYHHMMMHHRGYMMHHHPMHPMY